MHVNGRRHYQPIKEIKRLGQLARTWQRLIPDEKRLAFEEAQLKLIDKYVRRGVEHQPLKQDPIELHNGLMHEHSARSARLIDRTLRNGCVPHGCALSFRDGSREAPIDEPYWKSDAPVLEQRDHLPQVDVYLQHTHQDQHEISHFDSKSGSFVPQQSLAPEHIQVAKE